MTVRELIGRLSAIEREEQELCGIACGVQSGIAERQKRRGLDVGTTRVGTFVTWLIPDINLECRRLAALCRKLGAWDGSTECDEGLLDHLHRAEEKLASIRTCVAKAEREKNNRD